MAPRGGCKIIPTATWGLIRLIHTTVREPLGVSLNLRSPFLSSPTRSTSKARQTAALSCPYLQPESKQTPWTKARPFKKSTISINQPTIWPKPAFRALSAHWTIQATLISPLAEAWTRVPLKIMPINPPCWNLTTSFMMWQETRDLIEITPPPSKTMGTGTTSTSCTPTTTTSLRWKLRKCRRTRSWTGPSLHVTPLETWGSTGQGRKNL